MTAENTPFRLEARMPGVHLWGLLSEHASLRAAEDALANELRLDEAAGTAATFRICRVYTETSSNGSPA